VHVFVKRIKDNTLYALEHINRIGALKMTTYTLTYRIEGIRFEEHYRSISEALHEWGERARHLMGPYLYEKERGGCRRIMDPDGPYLHDD